MSCYKCSYITGHDPACPEQLSQDHSDLESLQTEVRELRNEVEVLKDLVERLRDWKDEHKAQHEAEAYDRAMRGS